MRWCRTCLSSAPAVHKPLHEREQNICTWSRIRSRSRRLYVPSRKRRVIQKRGRSECGSVAASGDILQAGRSRAPVLVWIHCLTELSSRNRSVSKVWQACKADILTYICDMIFYSMWDLRRLRKLQDTTACYRERFTYFTTLNDIIVYF
jgi:hypothetical protein